MKTRLLAISILIAGMALILSWAVTAQGVEAKLSDVRARTNSVPVTLNLNLSYDPTIDPAIRTDERSSLVVDQLFLGLVRVNPGTGELIPELASSWEMSSDAKVFTFTLRSDATWTDGNPVTAYDVRYGILRSLDPTTNSDWAYVLFVIDNAEEYNNGTISASFVGITVLDNTHIRFDLKQSAAYFPAVLPLSVARPMPSWTITAHPTDWTEPGNIVTNGPYKLVSWAHNVSMILDKNTNYYDASNVQIEHVVFSMVDDTTAWGMYQNGHLDSVYIPPDRWSTVKSDPILLQELHSAPNDCTYYYGFNTAKAPFDNVLVRKAFIAAVNRQDLIDNVLKYAQQPALTFTPPDLFGSVDGRAEGVGIPYNPTQAQQWLSEAGYPNGQGLPPITLMHNTSEGHRIIAEYVQQNWINNLNVTVSLSDMNWTDYLNLLSTDPPQVWRLGWCVDYYDAYNFLYDAIFPGLVRFGNWNNTTYDNTLNQASQAADANTRKALYKQAEEILVETDAVMLPIYYYANGFATKPYLERTYWAGGFGGRIADWRISQHVFLPVILNNH